MINRDQMGAAYHEAGHAVVAWALGLNVGRLAIAIGGDDAKGSADIEHDPDSYSTCTAPRRCWCMCLTSRRPNTPKTKAVESAQQLEA
jgi:hypothetical protein